MSSVPDPSHLEMLNESVRPNPTLEKYRFRQTLVRFYPGWVVLARPEQTTLGSLVLASTSNATSFAELSEPEYLQMRRVIGDIEATLSALFAYDRINYIMLMINDPNPHFHVIPRYSTARSFLGRGFFDQNWPKPPDFGSCLELNPEEWESLRSHIGANWRQAHR